MSPETSKRLLLGTLVLALVSGCAKKTPVTPDPVLQTETFTAKINVLGSANQNFIVAYNQGTSDASITVTGMSTVANATALSTTIGVAFGSLAFDGSCLRASWYTANTAAINQELTASGIFAAGTYCVAIFDSGTLTEPANVTFVVKHF